MATARQAEADLVAAAHTGDATAAAAMRSRHGPSGRRLAACYLEDEPDELVDQACDQLIRGAEASPIAEGTFRTALFATVWRLASSRTAAAGAATGDRSHELPVGVRLDEPLTLGSPESTAALRAFADVPVRLQTVLWMTEVDDRSPDHLAPVLGMTPNAVVALVDRGHEALRQAYLHRRAGVTARPGCRPHRARLGAYGRDDGADRTRTATTAHLEGCSTCRALAVELAEVTRLFRRALVPLFAVPDPDAGVGDTAADAAGARGRTSPAGALDGVRRAGRWVVTAGGGDLRVAVAIGVTCLLLAGAVGIATVRAGVPGDTAAPAVAETTPSGAGGAGVQGSDAGASVATTTGDGAGATDRRPGAGGPPPAPTAPVPALPSSSSPGQPAPPGGPEATAPPSPPPTSPPATGPATSATTPTVSPPSPEHLDELVVPEIGSVTWLPSASQVRVDLVNRTSEPTGFLVLSLAALGGALVDGQPSGCALGLGFLASAVCGLPPLGPGARADVHIGIRTTGPGQSVRVTLCSAANLVLDCETSVLPPTSVALD